jgi:hypothetical protein
MKKTITIGLVVALLALCAVQLLALQTGTWDCMGYTITVTPDDPANPSLAGTIDIVKCDDYADVNISGTYGKAPGRKPATLVSIAGTINAGDTPIYVERDFTFQPGPDKSVWKTIVSWIEGQIAA